MAVVGMRYLAVLLFVSTVLIGCGREAANVPPPASVTLPTVRPLVTLHVTVIGDSYVDQLWPSLLQHELLSAGGVTSDLQNGGVPGSGYVFRGPVSKTVFGEKAAQLIRPDEALVVFVGSDNDAAADSLPALASTVHDVFAHTKQTAPQAKLLVIGPIYHQGNPPPEVLRARDIVRDQATAVAAAFVDPIADGWLVGEPNVFNADGVPTQATDVFLGLRVLPLVATALSSAGSNTIAGVPPPPPMIPR
jgi:hypothetical protein